MRIVRSLLWGSLLFCKCSRQAQTELALALIPAPLATSSRSPTQTSV